MKIETAKQILQEHLSFAPECAAEAKLVLKRYEQGKIVLSKDQQIVILIYKSLNTLICAEMGREHSSDPKRDDRQAAAEKKRRRNNGWRS